MKPLISVIIPNFNHAPYLKQRIDSVLSQTYDNLEVILLDDCSRDNSGEILSSYKNNPKVKKSLLMKITQVVLLNNGKKALNYLVENIFGLQKVMIIVTPFLERLVGQLSENGTVAIAYTSSHLVDAHNIFIKRLGERIL